MRHQSTINTVVRRRGTLRVAARWGSYARSVLTRCDARSDENDEQRQRVAPRHVRSNHGPARGWRNHITTTAACAQPKDEMAATARLDARGGGQCNAIECHDAMGSTRRRNHATSKSAFAQDRRVAFKREGGGLTVAGWRPHVRLASARGASGPSRHSLAPKPTGYGETQALEEGCQRASSRRSHMRSRRPLEAAALLVAPR